jgi:regulator of sigma E protease
VEFLEGLGNFTVEWILPFLFVLTLVVFFHELGHFLVARWNGVAVKVFSVGFGPEIVGFTDRKGTRWKIAWIPLGGYVRFVGDENVASAAGREAIAKLSEEDLKKAFVAKPVGARAAIVAAGPIANFILAIVIYAGLFMFAGQAVTAPQVDEVQPDTPAAEAGFQPGDLVVSINGTPIETFTDFQRYVSVRGGETLAVTVERAGQHVDLMVTPAIQESPDGFGGVYRRGQIGIQRNIGPDDVTIQYLPLTEAIGAAADEVWFVISQTVRYAGRIISGREPPDQLGGPITVARVAGDAASISFVALVALAAGLSVSIGFVNLLPIPLLDGGHLLFFAIEAIRRRPLGDQAQEVGFRLGFVVVLGLILFVLALDLARIF